MDNKKAASEKSIEIARILIHALRELKDPEGSSLQAIRKFIFHKFGPQPEAFNNKLQEVLKRGVSFGAIKRRHGHYKLDSIMTVAARRHRGFKKKKKSNHVVMHEKPKHSSSKHHHD